MADKEGKEDCDVLEITPQEGSRSNKSERNKQLASKEKGMTPAKNSLHLPDEVRGGEENSNNQKKEKGVVSKLFFKTNLLLLFLNKLDGKQTKDNKLVIHRMYFH